ncbi:hypothetical protein [Acidovorax sp. 106]|uniref:hypothetical protein n=1 Tax=Acidovorax sp. 106 TaxID=2135637 RepID=UPI0018F62E68
MQGLPPVQLQVGSQERLRDDAVTMAARLKAAGCGSGLHRVGTGMVHCLAAVCAPCWMKHWLRWSKRAGSSQRHQRTAVAAAA